jgi:hypothetical protein
MEVNAQKTMTPEPEYDLDVKQVLPLNDSLVLVSLEKAHDEQGVAFVNKKAQVVKELLLPEDNKVIGISKWKEDVIVFYISDCKRKYLEMFKQIHAQVISVSEKKVLSDQVIYDNPNQDYFDVIMQNDPTDRFAGILIRETKYNNPHSFDNHAASLFAITIKMTLLDLTPEVKPVLRSIAGQAIDKNFIGARTSASHDLYVSSFTEDAILVEKFNNKGESQGAMGASLETRVTSPSIYKKLITLDTIAKDIAYVVLKYDAKKSDETSFFAKFDFAAKKVSAAAPLLLNKDYQKALKAGYKKEEDERKPDFSRMSDLLPVAIEYTADQVIVVQNIEYWYVPSKAMRFESDACLLHIYNRQMQLQKTIVLNKWIDVFLPRGQSVKSHLHNGKLYVVSGDVAGVAKLRNVCFVVDLASGQVTRTVLEREKMSGSSMEATSTLWFKDDFIITNLISHPKFSTVNWATVFQRAAYE